MGPFALETVRRFADLAVDALAAAREEIDALNVYPVPDGDTGTNMFLTLSAARDGLGAGNDDGDGDGDGDDDDDDDLAAGLAGLARGALLGARGNSGVILAELLGAVTRRIAAAGPDERAAVVLADALVLATEATYVAVGTPVEGTMLTVLRAAGEGAVLAVGSPRARSRDVVAAATDAARAALAHTPAQLDALRDAGVVDAGGRGLVVILEAADQAFSGRRPSPGAAPRRPAAAGGTVPVSAGTPGRSAHRWSAEGPAYEVMYLLDATPDDIPALRKALEPLGDSLVVVGSDRLWNVHVHVDDVGAAIEAGIEAGRPHRVRVTHFVEQAAERVSEDASRTPTRSGRRVVTVSAGPGLAGLFAEAGAVVVEGAPGHRPSTGEVVDAILTSAAAEVIVLPNDPDSARVARSAASAVQTDFDGGIRVAVVPTEAQVQGIAAMAVHDPDRGFDADVLEMTATARHARHGAVTIAARRAMTMAGPCEPGDVLGVVGGDFVVVGHDTAAVAVDVLGRLLGGGGELVTLVSGADDPAGELARAGTEWVEAHHPAVDVVHYDGGQERYPLLVSVE